MGTREEIAWAAGFWEGEGSIGLNRGNGHDGATCPYLAASQVTREPLDRLARVLGGRVYGPYHRGKRCNANAQPFYEWRLAGWENVSRSCKAMREWLSARRARQIDAVFAEYNPLRNTGKGGNNRLKTHCPEGHPYDRENTYRYRTRNGWGRGCRRCRRDRKRVPR